MNCELTLSLEVLQVGLLAYRKEEHVVSFMMHESGPNYIVMAE